MTVPNGPSHRRQVFAAVLVAVWVIGTVYAFWWFQYRDLRAFGGSTRAEFFAADTLRDLASLTPSAGGEPATVVHFWDPRCGCTRFSDVHVQGIIERYAPRGIAFVVVTPAGAHAGPGDAREAARRTFGDMVRVRLAGPGDGGPPSVPAAAVLTGDSELAYFGPLSAGAVCSVGKGDYVETSLERVLGQDNPHWINTSAFGCFCPWRAGTTI